MRSHLAPNNVIMLKIKSYLQPSAMVWINQFNYGLDCRVKELKEMSLEFMDKRVKTDAEHYKQEYWLHIYCHLMTDCIAKRIGYFRKILHLRTEPDQYSLAPTCQLSEAYYARKLTTLFTGSKSFRLLLLGDFRG